ncbi:MAG: exodeoxyribonuclease V subunit alpha [Candidatus Raymondbacteria bacterium RifOxyA12_full_50_37]|uniref:Exodeoxyribonuclease V subunit alpha n=1 Tax=Candidatus Raymondbacteria bacterium RIFOXYD12_FULL_49_13 TaxID=1817890 RepID=A0A1F7FA75_UNCRA|nr:MAG: exodeoxyribonuclease V subunit alpha [Candidatus Raymondbacteria bacterium RifOxyA12_full_50_37]OGJ87940.1 MAG: exodeoxyribonuclease V subunit alpha [Candidatus Raymondbacteria bacterium RIFOXYA2_FULL_49_16]OGJ95633.1 MAG: exodeoxyribonuclease V subunit alpha [Candidatus Raymondbacteria bacterium RIFOXYC2_FULL_50_21]OGK03289.1 MAG: exodeoxyribonuclease V subunit alpha [Candidatus Raymondbacteria bacterium RifOxyB12_full_50_8]OGK03406.1 MAG: exodeoxyribonuclease V subunit alpha [Candidat
MTELTSLDRRIAAYLAGPDHKELEPLFALLSSHTATGHVCLDLAKAGPEAMAVAHKLKESPSVGVPGEFKPVIIDKQRLYFYRYYQYEQTLAAFIKKNSLTVITGGPGTGKTTGVAKTLLAMREKDPAIRIALAAPTGKGASRLQEAVQKTLPGLQASTIHRLLKPKYDTGIFTHNAENPLPADVVVVDEASMVDIALMVKLIEALLPQTRLVLLGDKDQLASVEAGSVLADICATNADWITRLETSYRFSPDSGIGYVSKLVNAGNTADTLPYLALKNDMAIAFTEIQTPGWFKNYIRDALIAGYAEYFKAVNALAYSQTDSVKLFSLFGRFRVLCALKKGPYGEQTINALAREILVSRSGSGETQYCGRPIIITKNDYNLKLFNGDIGLILPDPNNPGRLSCCFLLPGNTIRRIAPGRLPEHETVFAMTVHKSQGSEFDKVMLVLSDTPSPVITRELIYTGITRARTRVAIVASDTVLETGITTRTIRDSGLREALALIGR